MLSQVRAAVLDSYRAPRRAARWVLDVFDRPEEAVLLFALAYCAGLIAIFLRGLIGVDGGGLMAMGPSGLIGGFVSFAVLTAMQVLLILIVCRIFDGRATPLQTLALFSWHGIVTAPLNLLLPSLSLSEEETAAFDRLFAPDAMGEGLEAERMRFIEQLVEAHSGDVFMMMIVGVIALAILAHFIAEANGFRSGWRVAGVMIGVLLLLGALLPILFAGAL